MTAKGRPEREYRSAPGDGAPSANGDPEGGSPGAGRDAAPAGERAAAARPRSNGRWILGVMAAIAIAPVALSYLAYYVLPRDTRSNYGTLLPTQPIAEVAGASADGRAFRLSDLRGQWAIVVAAPSACDAACERALYATRQARTIQNKEESRVVRLWLVTDRGEPPAALLAQHPGLVVAHVDEAQAARLPQGAGAIYLVDPLGNQVLAWPKDPDIKALAKDLTRLLKASRIG